MRNPKSFQNQNQIKKPGCKEDKDAQDFEENFAIEYAKKNNMTRTQVREFMADRVNIERICEELEVDIESYVLTVYKKAGLKKKYKKQFKRTNKLMSDKSFEKVHKLCGSPNDIFNYSTC